MNLQHRTPPPSLLTTNLRATKCQRRSPAPRAAWAVPLALYVALLGACSTPEKIKPVVVQAVVQNPGERVITVTERQSGAAIVLEPAQALVVRLATEVTSGRDWLLVDLKPGVLNAPDSTFERLPRNLDDSQSVGTTEWRFKPVAAGSVVLTFELRRPHSLAPAAQTVTFAVTVK
jgi:predicted secreted protein